jgi:uncharacterized Zn finger protein (UPF0148 family)
VSGYPVHCPECGRRWWSQSVSGVTRCGECRTRVYVPVDQRPRRYVEEQRARRRTYGKPSKTREQRREADEYGPAHPSRPRDYRTRRDESRRARTAPPAGSETPPAPAPALSAALASLLTTPQTRTRPQPVRRPARPTPPVTGRPQPTREVPPPKRTRAVLACGHVVILGGAPDSWYGVAAPCPTCGRDVNVVSSESASVTRRAGKV